MYKKTTTLLCAICACFIVPVSILAQSGPKQENLFDSDSILTITLRGDIKALLNDRQENSQFHPLVVSYIDQEGIESNISAEAKTRGHFRKLKANCLYPPLLLHFFKSDSLQLTLFKDQEKLKLVMPCSGDNYVVYEWLTYKLYNIISPQSFKARLVRIMLSDNNKKKTISPFYGILLEDENQMATRNNEIIISRKMAPEDTKPDSFLKMAVFEYMIGNTDWSVQYLQNIKLVATDSTQRPGTVPYDFDHAGIVNAPYAEPAEELNMASVLERRYRGYCLQDIKQFDPVIALYNNVKPAVYNLYKNCSLVDKRYLKTTIKYLDDFYAAINDPVALKKEFSYPCDKNGTGNIIIKGLKN